MATRKPLSEALLKEAKESREKGLPLPSGVSWNPTRNPEFMHADDIESMGDRDPVEPLEPPVTPTADRQNR
jgi:hypothetical protein